LAKLDNKEASMRIRYNMDPNWEIARHGEITGQGEPLWRVPVKDSEKLEEVFSQIDPGGAFFLSSAMKYLS
jgi:hypothetical protein